MAYGKKKGGYGKGMGGMSGGSSGKKMGSGMYGGSKMTNTGKPVGDKGMKAKGNKRTRQVADRYK